MARRIRRCGSCGRQCAGRCGVTSSRDSGPSVLFADVPAGPSWSESDPYPVSRPRRRPGRRVRGVS